jgi:hypothetical protein
MKSSVLTLMIGLVLGGRVLAQDASVGANPSGRSASSVSASGTTAGATASHASGASAAATSKHAAAKVAEGSEMNATLSKPIDTRRASPRDEVTATLAEDAMRNAGTPLPRGTKLVSDANVSAFGAAAINASATDR